MGVCVHDLNTGREIGCRLDDPLPMASVCKIPILVTAYRKHEAGLLDLAERIEITDDMRTFGSGLFNAFDVGIKPTVHDLLLMMIVVSDNAATDMILAKLDAGEVTRTMSELGLKNIRVERTIARLIGDYFIALDPGLSTMKLGEWDAYCDKIPGLKERGKDLNVIRDAVNSSASTQDVATVRDMANLCAQIVQNRCASNESCDAMLDIMNKQVLNGRLPRHLPQFTRFPHKTGTLGSGAVVNDAGILYIDDTPVATIAVLSRDVRDPIADTETTMAKIGRAVYDHYRA
jgi:beta-lactamase class A